MEKVKLFFVLFIGLLILPLYSQDKMPAGVIQQLRGKADIKRDTTITDLKLGDLVYSTDVISTKRKSFIKIILADNSGFIKIFSNSSVIITSDSEKIDDEMLLNKIITVDNGIVFAHAKENIPGKFTVQSESSVATVKNSESLIEITPEGLTRMSSLNGVFLVKNIYSLKKKIAHKGETVISSDDGEIIKVMFAKIPEEIKSEIIDIKKEHTMKLHFKNDDGVTKDVILKY